MNCNEIHQLIVPYLDSELDARTSCEIAAHLGECSHFAQLYKSERRFDERLNEALQPAEKSAALWENIEMMVKQSGSARKPFWKKLPTLWAVPAVLAAVSIAVVLFQSLARPDLTQALAKDHREFLAGEFGPAFTGTPSEQVLSSAQGRLDGAAFAKLPALPGVRTEGSRLCRLSGVPVAWTLIHYGNSSVSYFVLRQEEQAHFRRMAVSLQDGHCVVSSGGGLQIAARLVDNHLVFAVADLPSRELEALVNSVPEGVPHG